MQAAIKARTLGRQAKKFTINGQQIIQGKQEHLSEFNHDLFLSGCERGLKPLRSVRWVMKAVSVLVFVDDAFTHAVT
jgi:hypothetical protein